MPARAAFTLGALLAVGLVGLGFLLGGSAIKYREYERTVTVKGLSEREYPADVVIWPIKFTAADNDLATLYDSVENQTRQIQEFLISHGIDVAAITAAAPAIVDKLAQQYGGDQRGEFRYSATQVVTVYSHAVDKVRAAMPALVSLGKGGIALTGENYDNKPEYLFMRLNDVKPEMIKEATTKAREVALEFAADSNSGLGKIKSARQGQFSITGRDTNNEHIKKVRVVSTVAYYLVD
jgi:hypothetical protein